MPIAIRTLSVMDLQYPIAGVIVLVGAIAFLKVFDFLAAQSMQRLLEMAGRPSADSMDAAD